MTAMAEMLPSALWQVTDRTGHSNGGPVRRVDDGSWPEALVQKMYNIAAIRSYYRCSGDRILASCRTSTIGQDRTFATK